jgi:RNA polymerase sigma-70 factor (ECF subfamily)
MTFHASASLSHDIVPPLRCAAGASARAQSIAGDEATSDEVLVAHIASGDEAALRIFAARHVARCLAVAQRIIGNTSDAEEVAQDALLRVWLNAAQFQAGQALVTTWLYRIVVNLALDRLRKYRRRFVSLAEAGDQADPAPDAQLLAEGRQLESFIARAIAALPSRQRVALTLCYFEAMDCAEAASVMAISVSAMESLLVRGRRTLRDRLEALEGGRATRAPQRPPALRFAAEILAFPIAKPRRATGALGFARKFALGKIFAQETQASPV